MYIYIFIYIYVYIYIHTYTAGSKNGNEESQILLRNEWGWALSEGMCMI
jgi:hypothetical protein